MSVSTATGTRGQSSVRANGIDIHYTDVGRGTPLILIHGGMVSNGPAWAGTPFGYADHLPRLGAHFRVIAPDTRGAGATKHTGGVISHSLLADDVVALIDVLGLERPMICGFSDGGTTATVVGIRHPDAVRAIVNHAGYDLFNPQSPNFAVLRMMLGGSAEAEEADPDAAERFFQQSDDLRALFERLKADHDDGQGPGYWRTYITDAFFRGTRSPGYTFDDLRTITAPTLILTGDRDRFCSPEEAVISYRLLQRGELAILPDHDHVISPAVIATTIDFLERVDTG